MQWRFCLWISRGGFLITGKMLDLSFWQENPKDFFEFYLLPSALLLARLVGAYFVGNSHL